MKNKQTIDEKINGIEKKIQSLLNDVSLLKNSLKDAFLDLDKSNQLPDSESKDRTKISSIKKIKRVSSEEDDLPKDNFEQPKYDIKVVGLGVEKI